MKSRSALLAEKDSHLKAARALATKVEGEGRNFTPAERREVSDHMEAARALNVEIGDVSLIEQMKSYGGPASRPTGGRARDGEWAKGMTTYLGKIGAKSLTTSGTITVPSLSTGIITTTDRPRSILNLIPFIPLDAGQEFSYIREVLREHNATTVAVGKKKPESNYELERITDRPHTIAHLATVDRSLVLDVDLLQQYLEGALRDGVELELEDQVLNGNGLTTGVLDDLVGIINTSGTQAQVFDTDRVITARKAVTKLENLHLDPAGFAWVMSPTEWEAYELLQDTDHYVMAGPGASASGAPLPVDRAARRLWGYPVTTSTAMADGSSLLGDFVGSIEIREREEVKVEWAQTGYVTDLFGVGEHGDLWEANKVRFRGEGRWGLAVKRPPAFVEVDLTA